jgi:hypothetical protein
VWRAIVLLVALRVVWRVVVVARVMLESLVLWATSWWAQPVWWAAPVVPNPPASPPPGTAANDVAALIGFVKYGALAAIVATALAGGGALAVSKLFQHHSSRNVGVGLVLSAIGGAVLYASVYAVIVAFTG